MPDTDGNATAAVQVVAAAERVNLPAFYEDKPATWFKRADSDFIVGKITKSRDKAAHVIVKLPRAIHDLVEDIDIDKEEDPYAKIKERLTRTCGLTKSQRVAAFCDFPPMGDKRPSAHHLRLQQMLKDATKEDIIREAWLRTVPPAVRAHVADDESDMDDVVQRADRFVSANPSLAGAAIHAATSQPPAATPTPAFSDSSYAQGEASINAAPRPQRRNDDRRNDDRRNGGRRNDRRQNSNRQPPRMQGGGDVESTGQHTLCSYHRRFGHDALKCQSLCLMAGNGSAGARR